MERDDFKFQFSIFNSQSSPPARFYARRGAGGDRHHRPAGRAAPAGDRAARRRAKIDAHQDGDDATRGGDRGCPHEVGGGQYPPDGTNAADTVQFLQGRLPALPASNYPTELTTTDTSSRPTTALVFWLGGAQDASGAFHRLQRQSAESLRCQRQPHRALPTISTKALNNPRFSYVGTVTRLTGGIGAAVVWNLYQYFPPERPGPDSARRTCISRPWPGSTPAPRCTIPVTTSLQAPCPMPIRRPTATGFHVSQELPTPLSRAGRQVRAVYDRATSGRTTRPARTTTRPTDWTT